MMRERAGVMTMKSQHVKFIVAFQRQFGFEAFQVATHARHGRGLASRPENHGGVFSFQVSRHVHLIVATPMADVADMQIKMIAPKKWRRLEALACSEDVARGSLALSLSDEARSSPNIR